MEGSGSYRLIVTTPCLTPSKSCINAGRSFQFVVDNRSKPRHCEIVLDVETIDAAARCRTLTSMDDPTLQMAQNTNR